ncbi:gamma-glutamyltransferase [Rhizobium sp. DKSPLA3]|uniref:Glutathione hydrolase proenzyme n=1 Tax=Rhizobium quercicola TaxID=2901226 RepID=A0A9X1T052_9HYPH|nr:gamma-glutamyltransferase [Rhizobium quercicola]MCD7108714.1 gamma-glutamyltransferase [Rhizobium quercicola]
MTLIRTSLVHLTLAIGLAVSPAQAASPQPVAGENGMVVTAQHLASDVGVEILKQGGNAVDAAVAVGYALAVVYPTAGNIGGGGFMTVRLADGRTSFLDFRERAPLAATKTMYLDDTGEIAKGRSTDGYLAVGVPGSVAGFEAARTRFGTLSREALLAPAIKLAEQGFTLDGGDVASLGNSLKKLGRDPAAAAIFLTPDGKAPKIGATLVQPDLARSLAAISKTGPDAFYKGAIADDIVKASTDKGGILTKQDFARYAVRELKPVTCTYRGYEIISSPPPSSGGVILCEILNILEGYPLGALGAGSAATAHVMIEAMRYAYVDRNSALGDPDFVKNPVETLLDKAYAQEIRGKIDLQKAGVSAQLAPKGLGESHETTHYSIMDSAGNAVSVTYTLNGSFGAGVVAPGTGILLNNEMDDFTSKPGAPNLYGLVQGEANAIAPGKTPLSSMSPTIVTKDGKPFMVIGSPGGARIITITLEAILNVIDHGMTLQEAIDAPRLHHQWMPDTVAIEPFALSADTLNVLQGMGHDVGPDKNWPVWGQAAGILVGGRTAAEAADGAPGARYYGAMDSRAASGAAQGY